MNHITEMITRRPLARPLFLWIMGILLYVYVPDRWLFGLLFTGWLLLLLGVGVNSLYQNGSLGYAYRWLSGLPLALLLLTLSVETCYLRERYPATAFPTVQQKAAEVQGRCVSRLDALSLSDAEKSVLATLTLGYRQAMPREVRQQFAAAGVAHVLAVSGFHVAVVCGLLSGLTRFLRRWAWGRWLRYLLLLGGLWSFACLTGLSSSSVRASLMFTFYLTGKHLDQQIDSMNTLAAAAFCMLAYRPDYLFDVGFQLSFLAVWFIVAWLPIFQKCMVVRNPLLAYPWNSLLVALAAQMGTFGLTFFYFHQVSLLFLWVSFPISVIASWLLPATWLWLCLPFGGWIASVGQRSIEWLTAVMLRWVEQCAAWPFATLRWSCGEVEVIMIYALLGLGWVLLDKKL